MTITSPLHSYDDPPTRRGSAPVVAAPSLGGAFDGRYRLLEPLGSRGEGVVFRARDDILARDVAIKIFPLDPSEAAHPRRRLATARVLTALDHPALATVYDAHLSREGHGYLVMEFIPGPTLRQHLDQRGPVAPDLAATVLRDVADGLATVHDAGIVLDDIPSSIVLLRPVRSTVRPFTPVLGDFGVSQVLGARPVPVEDGYLPPERLHGGGATPASDIYALGLLAQEMLTAERPLSGGAVQELLLDPLDYDPEVPKGFGYGWELLLTAMTDPDPDARPSAIEVADLASELLEGPASLGPAADPAAAEPVTALRAVHQSRETSARRRRPPLWAWVTHYR